MTKAIIACIFTAALLLLSVHLGNPWVALISAFVWAFAWFPQWRSRWYKLLYKAVSKFRHDRCDPR